MQSGSPVYAKNAISECARSVQVRDWQVELLPHRPYEVSYTPEQSVIGYAFDSQVGTHAFAGDRRRGFQAVPNGLAWVPAGCDVYSQSSGGEYLRISCSRVPYRVRCQERLFSDAIDPIAINSAFALRRALLSGTCIEHVVYEKWLMDMESTVANILLASDCIDQPHGWLNKHRLRRIDEVIEARLETQLTVGELASEFGISAGFLSREFKSALGRTPHQYIIDKRLANARMQLHQSKQNLCAIAFACGFSSHSHMTAHFKERFGVTPAQLRREVN